MDIAACALNSAYKNLTAVPATGQRQNLTLSKEDYTLNSCTATAPAKPVLAACALPDSIRVATLAAALVHASQVAGQGMLLKTTYCNFGPESSINMRACTCGRTLSVAMTQFSLVRLVGHPASCRYCHKHHTCPQNAQPWTPAAAVLGAVGTQLASACCICLTFYCCRC